MKVSQRLLLGVVPSIVGLLTVAGLAYWGQYSRTAPTLVVVTAGLATVASLIIAWRNTRYVAHRVERLAAMRSPASEADELDVIEKTVESLGEAATAAKADARRATEVANRRADEYAGLISEAASSVSAQLAEARLSLHVLQENHFGELNDNQEEMINSARVGVDAAEVELAKLRTIADADMGRAKVDRNLIKPADIVRSLLPLLKSRAAQKNIRVMVEIEPGLPRVRGDRGKLRDALGLIFNDGLVYGVPGTSLSLHVAAEKTSVTIIVNHGSPHSTTADLMLAQRLIGAQGGSVAIEGDATVVRLDR